MYEFCVTKWKKQRHQQTCTAIFLEYLLVYHMDVGERVKTWHHSPKTVLTGGWQNRKRATEIVFLNCMQTNYATKNYRYWWWNYLMNGGFRSGASWRRSMFERLHSFHIKTDPLLPFWNALTWSGMDSVTNSKRRARPALSRSASWCRSCGSRGRSWPVGQTQLAPRQQRSAKKAVELLIASR